MSSAADVCYLAIFMAMYISLDAYNVTPMPNADGRLHVYVLPVGQGDGHVIQCPNGDVAIVDLGSSNIDHEHWEAKDITEFLNGHFGSIKTVVITHNDADHYNLIPDALPSANMCSLKNVYISCKKSHVNHKPIENWINQIKNKYGYKKVSVKEINDGEPCGYKDQSVTEHCGYMDICPDDIDVKATIIAANLGGCKSKKNKDSIVFKLAVGETNQQISIMFTADFEKDVPQQSKLIKQHQSVLDVTIYKLAHHGSTNGANFLEQYKPKAIFVSGDPYYNFGHPRCSVIDEFSPHLCRPGENDCCSSSVDAYNEYVCGLQNERQQLKRQHEKTGNDRAIFTTRPNKKFINIIHISIKKSGQLTTWDIRSLARYDITKRDNNDEVLAGETTTLRKRKGEKKGKGTWRKKNTCRW